jgi:type I restriction enzyme S subunit
MKEGWQIMDFELCLDKTKTTTKLQSSMYGEQGAFPIVSQEKELISGYWDNENDVFKHETPIVIFGDHTQVVKYIDFDFVIGADGVKILAPKSFLNPKYFYYWVMSVHIPSHGYARHYRYLKEHQVPVPPLSEQQRIVSLLDAEFAKIDTLKANAERNLQNAKDLFQAALKEELRPKEGWKSAKLSDVVKVINGRAYSKEELLPKGKYRVLRVGNFFTNDSWYYSDLELDEDKYCDSGDLLYAWSASFGPKIWDGEKVIYHYHIWKMLPSMELDKDYLYYWLQSYQLTSQVMSRLHGTTMVHITKGIMEATTIQYPSNIDQQRISKTLDTLNEKCKTLQTNYEKTIVLCDDLKQALLRKAFNGEI